MVNDSIFNGKIIGVRLQQQECYAVEGSQNHTLKHIDKAPRYGYLLVLPSEL